MLTVHEREYQGNIDEKQSRSTNLMDSFKFESHLYARARAQHSSTSQLEEKRREIAGGREKEKRKEKKRQTK
jgi:hypothetical protein